MQLANHFSYSPCYDQVQLRSDACFKAGWIVVTEANVVKFCNDSVVSW